MIKVDIVNEVSKIADITKVKAEVAVDAVFDAMRTSMQRGERIELRGFGVFQVKPRKRGIGRNPAPARKCASRRAAPSASSRAKTCRTSGKPPDASRLDGSWPARPARPWAAAAKFQDRVWLHVLLFALTIVTTTLVGAGHYVASRSDFVDRPLPPDARCFRRLLVQRHDPRDSRLPRARATTSPAAIMTSMRRCRFFCPCRRRS